MGRAGYVLVGGRSRRMGRDKALLPYRGATLAEWVAKAVAAAAGSAVLVGDAGRYGGLGFPVIPDDWPDCGPLGGIATALRHSGAGWNLVLACDMPGITAGFLGGLLAAAETCGADCLLPAGPGGRPEPLCAAYHARCLPAVAAALARGVRKVTEGLAGLRVQLHGCLDESVFRNCNTPADWLAHVREDAPEAEIDGGDTQAG